MATALRSTLQMSSPPAATGFGVQVIDTGLIPLTIRVAVTFAAPLVAVSTTVPEGAVADDDAENAPVVAPAGTVTVTGTLMDAVVLVSATVIPPTGAAPLSLQYISLCFRAKPLISHT